MFSATNSASRTRPSQPAVLCPEDSTASTSLMWTIPIMLSMVSRYIGSLACLVAVNFSTTSSRDAVAEIASMSRRGTMMS